MKNRTLFVKKSKYCGCVLKMWKQLNISAVRSTKGAGPLLRSEFS